jgi:hypothetical protein
MAGGNGGYESWRDDAAIDGGAAAARPWRNAEADHRTSATEAATVRLVGLSIFGRLGPIVDKCLPRRNRV